MRSYCPNCHFPSKTCLCDAIVPVVSPAKVTILQHVKEKQHAKNTARLVALCLNACEIIVSDDSEALDSLKSRVLNGNMAIIYPSDTSLPMEENIEQIQSTVEEIIIFDGSWRQAFSLFQSFKWLQTIPSYHFAQRITSQYEIRHTSVENGLSTLEAVAYTLSTVYGIDASPLDSIQQARIDHWQSPQAHRRKK